jgi:hypothetical protein
MVYVSFRTDSLTMFKWFAALSLDTTIETLRETTLTIKQYFPDWFLFSLPDGLWIFSYVSLMLLLWKNEVNKQNLFWIFMVPLIAIASEAWCNYNNIEIT